MKSIFDSTTRNDLIKRIQKLNSNCERQWGKMNVIQMVKHCSLWEETVHTNKKHKRPLIGILFGKFFLKQELKNENPMRQNNPTIPELMIKETAGDFDVEKSKWIQLMQQYESYSFPDNTFTHPFFGKMTKAQIGQHAYKHADHHLRQFGC